MSGLDRWRTVAGGFSARADGVPAGGWDAPAPCAGWTARDVVGHLVEWVPPLLDAGAGIHIDGIPPVDDDPAASWHALERALDAILADPAVSERRFDHPQAGSHPLDQAIAMFVVGDLLIHTWDLARATGQDERLDPASVHDQLLGMEAFDPGFLEASGQYGPAVPVAADADEQTRLLALTGRRA
jgi:uncharacterized protein (TIGR03086 family)